MVRSKLQSFKEAEKNFGRVEDKKYIVVFDLELTCWDGEDRKPMSEMEVTEIGAVVLKADTLEEVRRFSETVRPVVHPNLSEFCTQLTGITQEEVDSSPILLELLEKLLEEGTLPDPKEFIWASWGGDARWLRDEINLKTPEGQNPISFDPRFINIKLLDGRRRGLKKAARALGVEQELPAHRALPDAVTTAEVGRRLNMSVMDAQVSNEKTYKQALTHQRGMMLEKFSGRHGNLPHKFVKKLLEKADWDYQQAKGWLDFFKNNKSLL